MSRQSDPPTRPRVDNRFASQSKPGHHSHLAASRRRRGVAIHPAVILLESRTLLASVPSPLETLDVQVRPGDLAALPNLMPLVDTAGATVQSTTIPGLYEIQGPSANMADLAAKLSANPDVQYADPMKMVQVADAPNDPDYVNGDQWALNGVWGINAPIAWNTTTGSNTVIVADTDTGMDYNHPDLYDNVWLNQAEVPDSVLPNLTHEAGDDGVFTFTDLNNPANQGTGKIIDTNDDGVITGADVIASTSVGGWADGSTQDGDTAHPDDLIGWNFVNNTDNPMDDFAEGHGTHTAGIIGAVGDNGVGVSGTNWSVQVMPVEFLDSTGNGTDVAAAEAIDYAVAHGAKVINASWGGPGTDPTIAAAIETADQAGVIIVAAAGNLGWDDDYSSTFFSPASYSTEYPNVVAVAAIQSDGTKPSWSNYGVNSVQLAAPGNDVISTLPNDSYGDLSGTSMAAPYVAGTIALVEAAHPTWSMRQVIDAVVDHTTPDPNLTGLVTSGGVVNAGAAVADTNGPRVTAATPSGENTGGSGLSSVQLTFDEEINPATLTSSEVTLTGPSGTISGITISMVPNSNNHQFTLSFPTQSAAGTYTLVVGPDVQDWYGNEMNQNGNSVNGEAADAFTDTIYQTATGSSDLLNVTSFPTTTTAGTAQTITISALTPGGSVDTSYRGTIHFTSTDPQASLPANYTFVAGDNGTHTFTTAATLDTAGLQSITVTDTANSAIIGADENLWVQPAAAHSLVLSNFSSPDTAGTQQTLTLTAYDAYGNIATGYLGTVSFSSGDPKAVLPATFSFAPENAGTFTFTATLETSGVQSITATDSTDGLSVEQSNITVDPAAAKSLVFTGYPSAELTGTPIGFTITVYDAYGNVATGYTGTLQFTSSDPTAVLPSPYTFTSSNAGTSNFSATFNTAGIQSITATDSMTGSITQSISVEVSNPATASFIGKDTTTQGSWIGVYGSQGYDIVSGPSSIPSYATVTTAGQSTYTWSTTSSDPRALQTPNSSNRVVAVWYSYTSFTVGVYLSDNQAHNIELYAMDYDNKGRSERIQLTDAVTGKVLDTESLSNFSGGAYMKWTISGNVLITITETGGINAIVNGLFFDPMPTTTGTGVTSSLNPSLYGQSVTFTATVSDTTGVVPTGTVAFYDGSTLLGAGSALTGSGDSATSTFTTWTVPQGSQSISAVYSPTGDFAGSSGSLTQTVNASPATATFLGTDTTTQGNWINVYGSQGYNVINSGVSYPSYAAVTPAGNSSYTWAASTSVPQALEDVPPGTSRIAACWYAGTSFTVDVNLTYGQSHNIELYLLDYDSTSRSEQIQLTDGNSHAVLSTQTVSSFHNGTYLSWTISGNVLITITTLKGVSAVLSGLFFDPASSVSTSTGVTSSLSPSTYGQSTTFTATVSDTGGGVPTGSVAFYDGSTELGSGSSLSGSGNSATSTFTTSTLPAGSQSIKAVYTPSGNFATSSGGLTQTVNTAALTITANSTSKTYGNTLTFAGTEFTTSGLVNSDSVSSVTLTSAGASASATVAGSPYPIVPSAAVGSGLSNYSISYVNGGLTVTPRALTITATGVNKVYDGTTAATVTLSDNRVNGDTFTDTYSGALFLDKNAGTGKTVNVSGLSISGPGASNYTYNSTATTTANITAMALTVTAATNTKTYDSTTAAAATPTITAGSLKGSDTANFTETYATRNAGSNLVLTPSGTVNDGNSGNNYTYTFNPVSTGVINQAPLTLTAVTNTKVYDGTTSAAAVPTVTGLQGGDSVTNLTETYASPNVGTGITLNVATYTINDGDSGNNYTVSLAANNTGVITAPAATAVFVAKDTTTQGNWINVYGSQGYNVINSGVSYPSYATVTPAGNSSYTWAANTSVPQALEDVPPGTSRIAACWYAGTSFTVDVNLAYGQSHDIELYFLDYDSTSRSEQIQLTDANSHAVLSTQTVSSFHNGTYLSWTISGNVLITITNLSGVSAVLSGLFFDPIPSTTGTGVTSSLNPSTYGQSVTFTATVSDTTGVVPTGTVAFYDGSTLLGAGSALTGSGDSVTSTFTTWTVPQGSQSISAVYSPTGDFAGSSGSLTQTVNASPATATFLGTDTTTQGNWINVYGAQGYNVINSGVSYPSYAAVTPAGNSSYTWAASTSVPQALEDVPPGTSRIAACWYAGTSFTVDVNLTYGQSRNIELYLLDYDSTSRSEQIQLTDGNSHAVLSTQTVSSFHNGTYLSWTISGNVLITITTLKGVSAVLSGLFFDPTTTLPAIVRADDSRGEPVDPTAVSSRLATDQIGTLDFSETGDATSGPLSTADILTSASDPVQELRKRRGT